MEDSNYITIKDSSGRYDDFVHFMDATTGHLKEHAKNKTIDFSQCMGEKFEWIVLDQMKSLAADFHFSPDQVIHTDKQHFPDIISENYYGVEVKTTKSDSWVSTGSSITESLREDCVKKIFLMFGKLSVPNVDFRCKPYEECLYDISVTHNPRYMINMDLASTSQTIFHKMGVDYDDFRLREEKINILREYYREKYKKTDREMPWWIGDESVSSISSIKLYSSISKSDKDYLKICGFVLFPEVIQSKYSRLSLWLCSRHSIVNPSIRDMYSAGGQMNLYIDTKKRLGNIPKSISNLIKSIDYIRIFFENHSLDEDIAYYADYYQKDKSNFECWKSAVAFYIKELADIDINEIVNLTFDSQSGSDIYMNHR